MCMLAPLEMAILASPDESQIEGFVRFGGPAVPYEDSMQCMRVCTRVLNVLDNQANQAV